MGKQGTYIMHRREEIAYNVMVRKLEGRRPLWRPGHRWESNIKITIKYMMEVLLLHLLLIHSDKQM